MTMGETVSNAGFHPLLEHVGDLFGCADDAGVGIENAISEYFPRRPPLARELVSANLLLCNGEQAQRLDLRHRQRLVTIRTRSRTRRPSTRSCASSTLSPRPFRMPTSSCS
jgi:hypothetical protein